MLVVGLTICLKQKFGLVSTWTLPLSGFCRFWFWVLKEETRVLIYVFIYD